MGYCLLYNIIRKNKIQYFMNNSLIYNIGNKRGILQKDNTSHFWVAGYGTNLFSHTHTHHVHICIFIPNVWKWACIYFTNKHIYLTKSFFCQVKFITAASIIGNFMLHPNIYTNIRIYSELFFLMKQKFIRGTPLANVHAGGSNLH